MSELPADVVFVESIEVFELFSEQLVQHCVVLLTQPLLLQLQRTLHYALHLIQRVLRVGGR